MVFVQICSLHLVCTSQSKFIFPSIPKSDLTLAEAASVYSLLFLPAWYPVTISKPLFKTPVNPFLLRLLRPCSRCSPTCLQTSPLLILSLYTQLSYILGNFAPSPSVEGDGWQCDESHTPAGIQYCLGPHCPQSWCNPSPPSLPRRLLSDYGYKGTHNFNKTIGYRRKFHHLT